MIKLDGWITIGTKLSTEKFDKQISDLENKIDSEEKKQELLNRKTIEYKKELREANREVFDLASQYDKAVKKADLYAEALKKAEKVSPRTPRFFEFQRDYNEQAKAVDQLSAQLDKARKNQSSLRTRVEQTKLQYDKSIKSVDRLRGKIETISLTRQNREINQLTNGVGSAIKKVGRLALAVLSVRSAYSFLRQASSTWGQYNEQYARDLEYIRFALASGVAPILEKIVNLVATLMGYINYLSNAWFGKAIFASAQDFEKMKKSAGGVAKSTKEIRNNLASFDEISVLSNSGSTDGEGFLAPSFDLGSIQDVEIPEWIKWLGDHGQDVKNSLIGIGTAIGALKLSKLASDLGLVATKLSLLKSLGIVIAVKGVTEGVEDLKEYANDPSLQNLGKTIADVGESVVGVGIATGNLPVIAGGALIILTGKFIENWDEIRDTTQEGIDYLREKSPEIEKIFGKTGEDIYNDVLDYCDDIIDTMDLTFTSFNNIVYDYLGILHDLSENDWRSAWEKFKDIFRQAWRGISGIVETEANLIIRYINFLIEKADYFVNGFIDGLNVLGANIERVNFKKIPLLDITGPTMRDLGTFGIQGAVQSGESMAFGEMANSIVQGIANTNQNVTLKVEGSASQLFRYLKVGIDDETKRSGVKIITGGA